MGQFGLFDKSIGQARKVKTPAGAASLQSGSPSG